LRFQLLWHTVTVDSDDATLTDVLSEVIASVAHPFEASQAQHYRATTEADGLAISEQGDLLATVASPQEGRDVIQMRALLRALELAQLKRWIMLRGALVDIGRSRILLLGPPAAGKTLLTLRLGLSGAAIQGDGGVLVRDEALLALPRPLTLREGAAALVPEIGAILPSLPVAGGATWLDPARDLDLPWRLRVAPVDHVVVLERGNEGCASGPLAQHEVIAELERALVWSGGPDHERAGKLFKLLGGARGHALRTGELDETEEALRRLAC
jgi:hypothetical protein